MMRRHIKNSMPSLFWLALAIAYATLGDGGIMNGIAFWSCMIISQVHYAVGFLKTR